MSSTNIDQEQKLIEEVDKINEIDIYNNKAAEAAEATDDNKKVCPKETNDIENHANTKIEVKDTKNTKELKKCCFVELNPGVSYFNLFTYYLVQFSYVCAFTFIDAFQDYLLESKDYDYNISKDSVGKVNGDILLFDTLYLIAFIYIYGSFHDIFGRKILVVYGFLSMALSLFLYPLAGKVYPNLILVRLIFSNGICAVTTQPLLADYVNHRTKGFGGGIAAVVSGLGAIFAALFLLKLQSYMSIRNVYNIASGFCVIVAIVCAFGVKNVHRVENVEKNILKRFVNLYKKLKEGFKELGTNVPLRIGIAANSLSRMNTVLITLFLIMWVKKSVDTDEEAVNLGHMISGIGNSVGLISALLFGFLLEKRKFLLITNAMIVVGYVAFFLSPSPNHWLVFISISVASFGFYGLMTLGYVMVNQHCGHSARGSVMGINCLFGAIAILILAQAGGLAFDKIDKASPFVGAAVFSFILFFVVIFRRKELDAPPVKRCPVAH